MTTSDRGGYGQCEIGRRCGQEGVNVFGSHRWGERPVAIAADQVFDPRSRPGWGGGFQAESLMIGG
jgi:hypothetical protein